MSQGRELEEPKVSQAGAGGQSPRMLVIGGQSRNVGKTALVVDLIRAFPDADWLAMKITQYGHGVCASTGAECDCAPKEHAVALDEERNAKGKSDTSRFLEAGARRALWLRTKQGLLAEAMPLIRRELAAHVQETGCGDGPCTIIESNSVLGFLRPRLYLVVLDARVEDFKKSAARYLERADGFVLRSLAPAEWPPVPGRLRGRCPVFQQRLGEALPPELKDLVKARVIGRR